ncbi:MAG: hypothetical protein ACOCQ3_05420 [Natronomonas sp.]
MDSNTETTNTGVRNSTARRRFLKTAAFAGAGIVSVGAASGNSSQRDFPPDGITTWGAPVNLGNGELRTFTTVTSGGQPKYHGVHLDRSALTGLPDGDSIEDQGTSDDPGDKYGPDGEAVEIHHAWAMEYFVPFPETDATEFTFLGLSWNPGGHLPEGIYNVPHFDVHFHWLDAEFVDDISGLHEATYDIPEELIPAGFQRIPEGGGEYEGKFVAVRDMGEHLADLSAPDNQPGGFENTLIWGAYDHDNDGVGELTFVEPMVTTEYLDGLRGRDKREVAQPEKYARPGAYPRSYSVRDLPQEDAIAITIEDFTTADG